MKRNNSVSTLKDFREKERQQLGVGVSMVSFDTYVAWNIVIPSVLSALLWLVLFIVVVVLTCFNKLPHILFEMIQLSLPIIEEHEDCSCVKVGGHKIKKLALKILSLVVVPLTIVTIFFSFWNVWLVEEEARGACLSNFDCFPVFNGSVLQKTPVESCFMELFNISVGDLDSTLSGLPNITGTPGVAETVAVVRGGGGGLQVLSIRVSLRRGYWCSRGYLVLHRSGLQTILLSPREYNHNGRLRNMPFCATVLYLGLRGSFLPTVCRGERCYTDGQRCCV